MFYPKDSKLIHRIKIEPASNGYVLEVQKRWFTFDKQYVAKDLEEVYKILKDTI
jgi:hypothetical protein